MNNSCPILSICIPTNGVIEWVFPVLDSVYAQDVDHSLYEVVVMDNGDNKEFKKLMTEYAAGKDNLNYQETDAKQFMSEIATYKAARGRFIKFINHRTKLLPGTLEAFIDFVKNNEARKPVIYFTNGVLEKEPKEVININNFDEFVARLSYWSSWSTGMAFWKEDFDSFENLENANEMFPHTDILFGIKDRGDYIIDNRVFLDEIPQGNIPKGRYNLFHAFAVEYISIILDLHRKEYISLETFAKVKKATAYFLADQYYSYIFRKKKCSYDLSDYKNSIRCYYRLSDIKRKVPGVCFKRIANRFKR